MKINQNRRGVSLIELSVVIAVGATMLALAVVTFSRILTMRRSAHEHLERTSQTARLAEQFRRDVWSSPSTSDIADSKTKLTLNEAENRRIEYEITRGVLRRTLLEGDKIVAADTFKLPGASVLQFTTQEDQGTKRIGLLIAPLRPHPVEGEDPHGKPSRILAQLGRDSRSSSTDSGENAND